MEIKKSDRPSCDDSGTYCPEMPELKRLRYFYGQMLGAGDFQAEQNYFREKLKLHNRCLHGYGTVCGLMVVPEPRDADCVPVSDKERAELEQQLKDVAGKIAETERSIKALENGGDKDGGEKEKKKLAELESEREQIRQKLEAKGKPRQPGDCSGEQPTRVRIECGIALDCEGNEIVVRRPLDVDLWQFLSADDRKRVSGGADALYLSICYCEQPVDPVRPVLSDACGASSDCTYGKLRDAVRIKVTVDPPDSDMRCEPCCTACGDACLLLARIDNFRKGQALGAGDVNNGVRRLIAHYPPTTITGVSWTHGATYSDTEAGEVLGSEQGYPGLTVKFSRPVLKECFTDGVVDVWVIQGGSQRHGDIYHLDGDFNFDGLEQPTKGRVTGVRYVCNGGEDLDDGDRVLITIRCAFILDHCCRPVDGTHVGGRVPILQEFVDYERPAARQGCATPPGGYGPWTSGAGTPGGTFESWFYVQQKSPGKGRRFQEDRK